MNEAGLPVGLYRSIFVAHQQVQRLLEDPRVVDWFWQRVRRQALGFIAGKPQKQVLELGGNNALLRPKRRRSSSEPVEMAIRAAGQCGQSCIAAKRMLVHESLFDAFLAELINATNDFKVADPMDRSSRLAPLQRAGATLLERQVENVLKQGGQLIGSLDRYKACFSPASSSTNAANKNGRGEFFGPVFSLSTFSNRDDLTHQVNSSSFGLGVSLVGEDLAAMQSIAERLNEEVSL